MTPKQKANELVDKFGDHSDWEHWDDKGNRIENEKLCALICVDEIIECIQQIIGDQKHMWSSHEADQIKYWNNVKKELQTI